jgi:PAS domain S-box-containing protein
MKIKIIHKLIFGFVAVILALGIIAYLALTSSQRMLKEQIGNSSKALAIQTMVEIDVNIHDRIENIRTISLMPFLTEPIVQSNNIFEQRSNAGAYIDNKDRQWTTGEDASIQTFKDDLVNAPVSDRLREIMKYFEGEYGYPVFVEIFATNKFGANVAQSGLTSDYKQSDESWWQEARTNGLYVSDVSYDKSAEAYALSFGIRVNDIDHGFLGVIKVVLNIEEVIRQAERTELLAEFDSMRVRLIDQKGHTIYARNSQILEDRFPPHKMAWLTSRSGIVDDGEGLYSFAQSQGYHNYKGLGWILIIENKAKDIFAPVTKLGVDIALISLALIALSILVGVAISTSISRPISALRDAAAAIGRGDLNIELPPPANDEIGELAQAFNNMAMDLKKTTTSINNLNQEIFMRQQAQEQLLQLKQAMDRTLYVDFMDSQGKITYVNRRFCDVSGYTREELVGRDHRLILSKDQSEESVRDLWRTIKKGRVWQGEIGNKKKNGEAYWVQAAIVPVLDSQNNPTHYIGFHYDITDLKRIQKIEKEHESLKQALKAMEKILGIVGHELRTPLAAMRVTTELLLTETASEKIDNNMFLRSINGEAIRLAEIVNNLLEAARINSGKVNWNWSTVDLQFVCEAALEVIRPLVDPDRINLDYQIDPPQLTMRGDTEALQRLLINLVSNSAKHTSEGSIRITVRQRTENGDPWIELKVADTGEGIPDDIIDKLGKAFVLNAGCVGSDYVKGTGLGLAICSGIVAAHGGSVHVESVVGQGASLSVRMPAELNRPVEVSDSIEIGMTKG